MMENMSNIQEYIDLAACSTDILALLDEWREDLTSSDHNGIEFNINTKRSTGHTMQRTTRMHNIMKVNWIQFRMKLNQLTLNRTLNTNTIAKIHTSYN